MKTKKTLEAFADSLAALQPTAPDVSSGEVMFQAGVEHANRQHESTRQTSRNKMRVWQFATAASLLFAATSTVALFNSGDSGSGNDTPLAKRIDQPKQSIQELTPVLANNDLPQNQRYSPRSSRSLYVERNQQRQRALQFFGLKHDTRSQSSQRQRILSEGITALPENKSLAMILPDTPPERITSRSLVQQLLGFGPE